MLHDSLAQDLYTEICRIPLIDPHSHIDPHRPTARNLDEILGYHYYTELAHSAGMDKAILDSSVAPRERVRTLLKWMNRFDNTVQYVWFVEIVRAFFDFQEEHLTQADCDVLYDNAKRLMAQPDWEEQVLRRSHLEKVFLTNDFDDPLEGFDTRRYVPCLRTDDLVFHLHKPEVRQRWHKATGQDLGTVTAVRRGITKLFEHFRRHQAKACAISLPPDFAPHNVPEADLQRTLTGDDAAKEHRLRSYGLFWMLAEHCREFKLPFDLMIGVNRRVYADGVYQGQDLFDQRTSLLQYRELFNAFPQVTFCISVLSHSQNQELASYSWIFPNVVASGHWWYSNIPAYIELDARARLQAVPKHKQLGYYSDMYKLEFALPKYNMYRRILAKILADDFLRTRVYNELQVLDLAKLLLRENTRRIFDV
jgi:glucuronate isomerase